jgi:hypothetical protein
MAASAGLRKTRAVVRFADEFASLGSEPTPHHLGVALTNAEWVEHEENGALNQLTIHTKALED